MRLVMLFPPSPREPRRWRVWVQGGKLRRFSTRGGLYAAMDIAAGYAVPDGDRPQWRMTSDGVYEMEIP